MDCTAHAKGNRSTQPTKTGRFHLWFTPSLINPSSRINYHGEAEKGKAAVPCRHVAASHCGQIITWVHARSGLKPEHFFHMHTPRTNPRTHRWYTQRRDVGSAAVWRPLQHRAGYWNCWNSAAMTSWMRRVRAISCWKRATRRSRFVSIRHSLRGRRALLLGECARCGTHISSHAPGVIGEGGCVVWLAGFDIRMYVSALEGEWSWWLTLSWKQKLDLAKCF